MRGLPRKVGEFAFTGGLDLFDGFRFVAAFRVDQTLSVRREADCRVRDVESSCFIVSTATLIRRKAKAIDL